MRVGEHAAQHLRGERVVDAGVRQVGEGRVERRGNAFVEDPEERFRQDSVLRAERLRDVQVRDFGELDARAFARN